MLGKASQSCLLSVQTVRTGAGKCGSAKAPTATLISSGSRSLSQNTVDPQLGQNWKVSHVPLSPWRRKARRSPSVETTWLLRQNEVEPNSAPVRRGQARQWQDETGCGSPASRIFRLPQWQAAWRSRDWTMLPPNRYQSE